jgi:hypothetical protein
MISPPVLGEGFNGTKQVFCRTDGGFCRFRHSWFDV